MPDTLLASLASTLKPSILEVARSLGKPEQAISRGFELAVAAVFEDLTGKTDDLEMLRQVIDLASKTPPNLVSTAVSSGQLTNSNSALIAGGKRLLSILFGNRENALLASMSRESGLGTGAASTVPAVAAQSVLTFLGTRVRNEGMSPVIAQLFISHGLCTIIGHAIEGAIDIVGIGGRLRPVFTFLHLV
jgi:hypothetical protein